MSEIRKKCPQANNSHVITDFPIELSQRYKSITLKSRTPKSSKFRKQCYVVIDVIPSFVDQNIENIHSNTPKYQCSAVLATYTKFSN